MKRFLWMLALWLINPFGFSQSHNDRFWIFGNNPFILNFDSATSSLILDPQNKLPLAGTEGNTTVVDPITKEALFYTDGLKIVDNSFQTMPNGAGLNSFGSSAQSGLVCPLPETCTQYYVFSNNCAYDNDPFALTSGQLVYSIVDLLLPGNGTTSYPLGDVIAGQKNILLHNSVSEAMCIVSDSTNFNHYWLLGYNPMSNSFLVFEITASSITQTSSYMLPFTYKRPVSFSYHAKTGKLAVTSHISDEPCLITNFNSVAGTITSHTIIPGTPFGALTPWAAVYDTEWSYSGNKLYISRYRVNATNGPGGQLYQYNLQIPAVPPVLIFQTSGNAAHTLSGMRLASDKRIYLLYRNAQTNNAEKIGAVQFPEISGTSCNFIPSVFQFPSDPGNINRFPEFVVGNPVRLEIATETKSITCLTDSIYNLPLTHPVFTNPAASTSYQMVYAGSNGNANIDTNTISLNYPYLQGNTTPDSVLIQVCDNRCLTVCDTMTVLFQPVTPAPVNQSIEICSSDSVLLSPSSQSSNITAWQWSTGDPGFSIYVNVSGYYTQTTFTGNCTEFFGFTVTFNDSIGDVFIPNVFSPNQDGKNDTYHITGLDTEEFSLDIYNRWGQRVFTSRNPTDNWNGEVNHSPAPEGAYYVQLRYVQKCGLSTPVQKNYFITLLR